MQRTPTNRPNTTDAGFPVSVMFLAAIAGCSTVAAPSVDVSVDLGPDLAAADASQDDSAIDAGADLPRLEAGPDAAPNDPLHGYYQTASHTRNPDSCTTEGPQVSAAERMDYFALLQKQGTLFFHECEALGAAACSSFVEPAWSVEVASLAGVVRAEASNDTVCEITWHETKLTVLAPKKIRLQRVAWYYEEEGDFKGLAGANKCSAIGKNTRPEQRQCAGIDVLVGEWKQAL